jgi:ribosomal protein S19
MAVCSQIKVRTQLIGESLQEFAPATKQLAHQALVGLPHYFIQREAA